MFQSVKTIFRQFFLPYFEVANASMLNIYGTAAACVWLCRLCLCSFAGVRPVIFCVGKWLKPLIHTVWL